MPSAKVTRTALLTHARYISWRASVVTRVNRRWREQGGGPEEHLMTGPALDFRLYQWAVGAGLMKDPHPRPTQALSAYLAVVFKRHGDAMKDEARNYWRELMEERNG